MLTGKQKSFLKKEAHNYDPIFQIGKDGVTEVQLNDILNYLNKHELMKVKVLETCPMDKEAVAAVFASKKIHVVGMIGSVILLYKANHQKENRLILPRAQQN